MLPSGRMFKKSVADGLKNPIPFRCPFCSGECCAGYSLSDDTPVVLHSMPYCSQFARDEGPEKFLQAVNERTEK